MRDVLTNENSSFPAFPRAVSCESRVVSLRGALCVETDRGMEAQAVDSCKENDGGAVNIQVWLYRSNNLA